MVAWLILFLLQSDDVFQRYEAILSESKLQQAVVQEKQKRVVSYKWETSASAVTKHYIASEDWCAPCKRRIAQMRAENKEFTVVTMAQARAMGQTVTTIPHEFDFTDPPDIILTVDSPMSTAVLQHAILSHLQSTSPAFFEIDVDVPDTLPATLFSFLSESTWKNENISVSWQGTKTITVTGTNFSFTPPIDAVLTKGPIKITTSIDKVGVDKQSVHVSFTRFPDLTIRFK